MVNKTTQAITFTILVGLAFFLRLCLPAYGTSQDDEKFKIVALGDWGCSYNTMQIVDEIKKINPDLVLGLGDYVFDNKTSCFFDMIQPFHDRMKIAFGKHDVSNGSVFRHIADYFKIKSQYYSFNFRNVHFIAMSTEIPLKKGYPQYDFVKYDLENASKDPSIDWLVVYYHRPAYTTAAYDLKQAATLRNNYHPLFDEYGVDLVLQAHNHYYQRTYPIMYDPFTSSSPFAIKSDSNEYEDPNKPIFLTVGTGGGDSHKFQAKSEYTAAYDVGPGLLVIEISPSDKELKAEFYSVNNGVADQFTLRKSAN